LPFGTKEVEELPEVVDQPSNLHPFWLPISADSLCSLQQMANLRYACLEADSDASSEMVTAGCTHVRESSTKGENEKGAEIVNQHMHVGARI